MKSQQPRLKQFQELYNKFRLLQSTIPENIRWKLAYYAKKIRNQQTEQLTQEQQRQVKDLEFLNAKGLAIIFNSIAATILQTPQQVLQMKCKVRFPGVMQFWKDDGFIKINKTEIIAGKSSRIQKLPISKDLQIILIDARTLVLKNKKTIKIQIKFLKPEQLKDFKNIYTELVMPQKKLQQQIYKEKVQKVQIVQSSEKEQQSTKNLNKSIRQEMHNKTLSFLEDFNNSNYLIYEQKQKLIFRVHKQQPQIFIQLYLKADDPMEQVMSALINQKGWNTSIKQEAIIGKVDTNVYNMHRLYKPYSYMSYERQTITLIQYERLNDMKSLIMEQSTTQKKINHKAILSEIKTIIYYEKLATGAKIIIESKFNGKGYCSSENSKQMLIKIYRDIQYFEDYYKICKLKNSYQISFFSFVEDYQNEQCVQILHSQSNSEGQEHQKNFELNNYDLKSMTANTDDTQKTTSSDIKLFRKFKSNSPNAKPTQQYLNLLQKKIYESFYLNKRFNMQKIANFSTKIPWYCLNELLAKGGQYEISQEKQLVMINYKLIESQKNTLTFCIKQIGVNLISGKSVLNISLPVDIFQSKSLLERSAASFGYAPHYLLPSHSMQPIQQMKNVFRFLASIPTLQLNMKKPFNPILGETFQGYLKGIPIFYEQISHHPPISAYYMKCDQFLMYGNLIAYAQVGINSAVGGNNGAVNIIFKNGSHFMCYFPPCEISGLIYGKRKFRQYGRGYIIQKKSRLFCEFSIEKQKKGLYENNSKKKLTPGDILGGIFTVNSAFIKQFQSITNIKNFNGLEKKHIVTKKSHINGIWFEKIFIDDIETQNGQSYEIQYPDIVLPSDSNFRLDVMYLRAENQSRSQIQKQIGQTIQRSDKKLRQKFKKSK